jgi:hypothetical protein
MSGDSHSTDYIDCGASSSSMMLKTDASRMPASLDIGGMASQMRDNAMLRYMEKKKNRRYHI